jgi:hypothetical protein
MANDINSAVQMLKGILGDGAEDKINAVINGLGMQSSGTASSETLPDEPIQTQASEVTQSPALPPSIPNMDGLQSIMKMKDIMDNLGASNDSRSQLLRALRPYMRSTRQRGIDSAIKLMNLTKMTGLFK